MQFHTGKRDIFILITVFYTTIHQNIKCKELSKFNVKENQFICLVQTTNQIDKEELNLPKQLQFSSDWFQKFQVNMDRPHLFKHATKRDYEKNANRRPLKKEKKNLPKLTIGWKYPSMERMTHDRVKNIRH